MSKDFDGVLESIRSARAVLTPIKSEEKAMPRWMGAPAVEVEATEDGGIKVELSRSVKSEERRFLKENGYRSAEDGKTWVKEGGGDGDIQEAKEFLKPAVTPDRKEPLPSLISMSQSEAIERAMGKGSANEVFAEFSRDVAALKVAEAFGALESSDRQRAQETILGYALGKPVERTISLHANIANMSKEELLDQIRQKLDRIGPQVGIEGTARGHSLLIDDSGGSERGQEVERVQAQPGISGEVSQEP